MVSAHTDARKRRRRFNVGRVLVLNNPRTYRRADEQDEMQRRSSVCSQPPPCLALHDELQRQEIGDGNGAAELQRRKLNLKANFDSNSIHSRFKH